MNTIIRPYAEADENGCLEVFDSNVPKYFSVDERADYNAFLRDPADRGTYLVMERGREIVGCGGFYTKSDGKQGGLTWGMVRRDLHGTGLGKRLLLERLFRLSQTPELESIALDTGQHTFGFFEKLGFVTHNVTPDGYWEGLDRYDMKLELDQTARERIQSAYQEVQTMIKIRPFQKPEDFGVAADILNAVEPEWPVTPEMLAHWDSNHDPKYFRSEWVAEYGDAGVVALAHAEEDSHAFEEGKYLLGIRVRPEFRRKGIGEALYQHLLKQLKEPKKLVVGFAEDKLESRRFVEKRGFVEEWRRYNSRLQTKGFDFTPYTHIEKQVQDAGLEIKSLTELLEADPDAARKLYELDWVLFQDVPMGLEFTKRSFEQWMKEELDDPHFVKEACFVAVDPRRADPFTGSLVGYTSLMKNPAGFWVIGMTGVLREYRGKGLAKALKLRGMRYVQEHGEGEIRTTNDPPNVAMLGINLSIGFKRDPSRLRFAKRLSISILSLRDFDGPK